MKQPEELRIDFPDYPAEEQKKDAQRTRRHILRHVYLMKVDGEWAHFIVGMRGKDDIAFYGDRKLDEVYYKLSQERPEYTPKVIYNEGLENYLRDMRPEIMKKCYKELTIKFEEKGNGY